MLNEVLKEINNYFPWKGFDGTVHLYTVDIIFTATDTMTGDFEDTYMVGEYVKVSGSRLNNGVFKISAITDTTITIDTTVDQIIKEEEEIIVDVVKVAIPDELVAIINDIETYDSQAKDGLQAESQADRSVTYSKGSSGTDVFRSKLAKWNKVKW